ncbi:tetratricopeptide repeat protein [candidate division WOR-3 bacterium]|nr:tetratricopeptide repeat protein [candidate division WOR-3 bacterium]
MSKRSRSTILTVVLIAICGIAFLPSLQNGITNWDDHGLVVDNVSIRGLAWDNIKTFFSSYYIGTYIPLTIFSFAVEYHFFQDDARVYHIMNLFLHLLNCVLVFWLIYVLSGDLVVSLLTALMFGVHPLRVESVAWVAGRKDLLYSAFYLGALISYVYYTKRTKVFLYFIPLVLFLLAVLSKGMAAVLTFALLLIDYYLDRRFGKKIILEKIPFFVITIVFMIVAVYAQQYSEALRPAPLTKFPQTFFVATHGFLFYLSKTAAPFGLSALYPHPGMKNGFLPLAYLISPVLVIAIVILVAWARRYTKKIVFGSLFFTVNTLMILGFMPVAGPAIVADRYIYIASIGLFFIIAEGVCWFYNKPLKSTRMFRHIFVAVMIGIIGLLGIATWQRCTVWKSSMTLWNDVLSKYKNVPDAYNGRGLAFYDNKEFTKAIKDFDRTIALNPLYVKAYYNRANAYDALQDYDRAIADYSLTISLDPNYSKAYNNRGLVYSRQGRSELALADFTRALMINPLYTVAYNNRGLTYGRIGDYDRAIEDFTKAVRIDPTYKNALYNRAITYYQTGQYAKALQDAKQVEELGESVNPRFMEALRQAVSR